MTKPLAIDLFCGLGGWAEGLLAEGWDVIGFDIERHRYPERVWTGDDEGGTKSMSGKNKNGTTLINAAREQVHGFHTAPMTGRWIEYPGLLAIQDVLTLHGSQFKGASLIVASPPCQEYSYMAMPWSRAKAIAAEYRSGKRDVKDLTRLFDACFRLQREACEASGRHIPLIVENVRGAIPWVGRSRWNFGSFHLWGDVPALMPVTRAAKVGGFSWSDYGKPGYKPQAFNGTAERRIADGHKVPGFRFDGSGRLFQTASVNEHGIKNGNDWFGSGADCSLQRRAASRSPARKAASAMIAKIPLPLSRHIAQVFKQ